MKIFSRMYDMVMRWAVHRHAPWYLAANSFAESVFWPIPPDVMLAPMSLSAPARAWRLALLTTLCSVAGAIVGYWLGYLMFDPWVLPMIKQLHYEAHLATTQAWFARYGIWVVLIAAFTPIPYKVFTVTAGLLQMAFLPFVLISLFGRGLRFFLVAGLMKWGGARMERRLRKSIDILGWLCIVLAVIFYLVFKD